MRHGWMALALSALCLLGKGVLVTGQVSLFDDLYLEEQQSGDYSVLDNDDEFNSGSGSGFIESDDEDVRIMDRTQNIKPTQHSTQTSSPRLETTSFAVPDIWVASTHAGQQVTEKEKPQDSDLATSTSMSPQLGSDSDKQNELQSENLTEVLAAVIAGGVIGFLFAIFLILLLVYRMRKKDEGSYDLGERKLPNTAYQKAPDKEFYA
ncbi:syndecan-2-like isoform 1-T1 [Clarias gariepinus]|uniref:syndecan-2-like isoform X1 n=1 Tax=Clarias gariepinus TaxID=13013 RepID=UPI00234CC813|nr:syndecan-2-like isoform X1 [Clarias gariepinus]